MPVLRKMEQQTFVDPEVVAMGNARFVPLKLRPDESEELTTAFEIGAIPATVLVAPNRVVIAKREGFADPDEFHGFLKLHAGKTAKNNQTPSEVASTQVSKADANSSNSAVASKPQASGTVDARLALAGYCPVSLVEDKQLSKGVKDHSVVHQGWVFHFDSPECRETFLANPHKFIPSNEGFCLVSELQGKGTLEGNPRFGAIFRERLYVFADEESRALFLKTPRKFVDSLRLRNPQPISPANHPDREIANRPASESGEQSPKTKAQEREVRR